MAVKRKKRKRRKTKTKAKTKGRKLVCSSCRTVAIVQRFEMLRAARLRCPSCGGPLNIPSQA